MQHDHDIIKTYLDYLAGRDFPCVAAREAVARNQVSCFVASHMACPHDDAGIIDFLYDFIEGYRKKNDLFHSAAIIFRQPLIQDELMFDKLMWQRLQALSDLDAKNYKYDNRVKSDPGSEDFSFSLKEEAFFIIGLHPKSSRATRQFPYAVLVFNPHAQFEKMRESDQYNKIKKIVRKRDIAFSGSVNPMLEDFGRSSEVYQYSGRQYDKDWQCPLKINHGASSHHSSTERGGISIEERSTS